MRVDWGDGRAAVVADLGCEVLDPTTLAGRPFQPDVSLALGTGARRPIGSVWHGDRAVVRSRDPERLWVGLRRWLNDLTRPAASDPATSEAAASDSAATETASAGTASCVLGHHSVIVGTGATHNNTHNDTNNNTHRKTVAIVPRWVGADTALTERLLPGARWVDGHILELRLRDGVVHVGRHDEPFQPVTHVVFDRGNLEVDLSTAARRAANVVGRLDAGEASHRLDIACGLAQAPREWLAINTENLADACRQVAAFCSSTPGNASSP